MPSFNPGHMDIKSILKPRNGMIFSGLIILLLLGLGPISGGAGGEPEMFGADAYGDLYVNASADDKESIDKVRSVAEFTYGAAGVSIAVFILALAFLTEGTTQAKAALLSGGVSMLWAFLTILAWSVQGFGFFIEMIVMFAIFTAPMFAGGFLHLNDDEGEAASTASEAAAE